MHEVVKGRSVRVGFGCGCGFDVDAHELLGVHSAGRAKPAGRPMCGEKYLQRALVFFQIQTEKNLVRAQF